MLCVALATHINQIKMSTFLFENSIINFLRHFVDSEWVKHIDENNLQLCDKGFVDLLFNELESDLIYSAKILDREVYFFVLTELQSTIDFTIPFRIFKYTSAILTRLFDDTPKEIRERANFQLPAVVPILFYNGEKKWSVTQNFKDYLQGGDLFKGVINFKYTLVDINALEREYLISNHDAISMAITVDKVRGEGFEPLLETLSEFVRSKASFKSEESDDFLSWLKHTLEHRVGTKKEADEIIGLIEKGDDKEMRTGIDIMFDNAEARGAAYAIIKTAAKLVNTGMDIREVSDRLELTESQIEELEKMLGLSKNFS